MPSIFGKAASIMWTTRLKYSKSTGGDDVILSGGDQTFVVPLDDWWSMSATQHLANKALKDNDLDFRIGELYGPPRTDCPLWTTELVSVGDSHDVRLFRSGEAVVVMSLEEWAKLSATEFAMEDSVEVAQGLLTYGNNIKEVIEFFEDDEVDGEDPESPRRFTPTPRP
jgi:hypothetical protein